jgi:hypothetical protein
MANFPETTFSPTMVDGMRGVGTDIVSTRIKPDVADQIFTYQPNGNAVALLLVKTKKKRKVGQYQFYFLQKDRMPVRDRINLAAGYDANDVSIVVDNGDRFYARAVVLNTRTMERFIVKSVSSNTLTIESRGLGNTADDMQNNDELEIIGTAYPEGAGKEDAKSIKEEAFYNYCQTIRTQMDFTGRDLNTDMFGGKDLTTEQKWQASEHTQKIERAFLWGARATWSDSVSAKTTTTMGGVHYFIQNYNEWDLGGIAFNERNLTEYLEEGMRYGKGGRHGSKTKWLFAASRYATEMNGWGLPQTRYNNTVKILGIAATKYQTFHGTLYIVDHPLFEGDNADKAFMLDMNHLQYVFHQGRDTQLRRNVQNPDIDGKSHEWLSDVSLDIVLPAAHGFWRGISL